MRKKVRKPRASYAVGYDSRASRAIDEALRVPLGRPFGLPLSRLKLRGGRRTGTAYRSLGKRAAAGDAKALDYLLSLESEEHPPGSDQTETERSAAKDLAILQDFFDRRRPSLPRHDDQQCGPGTKERGNK